ncbi:hypothetical protein CEP53_007980 [Fusarium sp. AF-6]|nr:hypothetical protein CEP53_007980 [Fusarium sp. AF-6]
MAVSQTHEAQPLDNTVTPIYHTICVSRHLEAIEKARHGISEARKVLTGIHKAIARANRWVDDGLTHDILGHNLSPNPGDVAPSDRILIDGSEITCDESSLKGESGLEKKTAGDGVFRALNEPLEDEGLKRASSKAVNGSIYLVSEVCLNTRSGRGLASLPGPNPLEENPQLKRFVLSRVRNRLTPPDAHSGIIPSPVHIFDSLAKLSSGMKNAWETISKIDFEKYRPPFIPLALLIRPCPNPNSIIGSVDSPWSSPPIPEIPIPQYCRRLRPALDQALSSYRSVVSDAKSSLSINVGPRRQPHWKLALTLIASGVTASGTAAAVIPLRTIDDVPSWAWISDYTVWIICFAAYLTLQIHHIPHHRDHRRQLYLFLVILLAIHFAIALAQSSPTLIDGFTIFGPMVLTVTTFLVALLFGAVSAIELRGDGSGTGENTTDTSPHSVGIGMTALSMCA